MELEFGTGSNISNWLTQSQATPLSEAPVIWFVLYRSYIMEISVHRATKPQNRVLHFYGLTVCADENIALICRNSKSFAYHFSKRCANFVFKLDYLGPIFYFVIPYFIIVIKECLESKVY